MNHLDLSIIIVNWNSAGYLRRCLHSILASVAGLTFEVLVIDNASYDGCADMIAREFPRVRFIQSAENLGFPEPTTSASSSATAESCCS